MSPSPSSPSTSLKRTRPSSLPEVFSLTATTPASAVSANFPSAEKALRGISSSVTPSPMPPFRATRPASRPVAASHVRVPRSPRTTICLPSAEKAMGAFVPSRRRKAFEAFSRFHTSLPVERFQSRKLGPATTAISRLSGENAPPVRPSMSCAPGSPSLPPKRRTSRPVATSQTTTSPPPPVATRRLSDENAAKPKVIVRCPSCNTSRGLLPVCAVPAASPSPVVFGASVAGVAGALPAGGFCVWGCVLTRMPLFCNCAAARKGERVERRKTHNSIVAVRREFFM